MNCTIICSSIIHAVNEYVTYDSCNCQAGYAWNGTDHTCKLDCSNVDNRDTENPSTDPTKCKCKDKFVWNEDSLKCDADC